MYLPQYIQYINCYLYIQCTYHSTYSTLIVIVISTFSVPTTVHTVETHSLRFLAAVLHEVREEQLVLGDKMGIEKVGERLV